MNKFPQVLINVRLAERIDIKSTPSLQAAVAQAEAELSDSGRVLLRASGTEPVIRVMVEGRDAAQVKRLADQLADAVRAAL